LTDPLADFKIFAETVGKVRMVGRLDDSLPRYGHEARKKGKNLFDQHRQVGVRTRTSIDEPNQLPKFSAIDKTMSRRPRSSLSSV